MQQAGVRVRARSVGGSAVRQRRGRGSVCAAKAARVRVSRMQRVAAA